MRHNFWTVNYMLKVRLLSFLDHNCKGFVSLEKMCRGVGLSKGGSNIFMANKMVRIVIALGNKVGKA